MTQSSRNKFKSGAREKAQRNRQRILFGVLAFLLIVSWVLSLVITN